MLLVIVITSHFREVFHVRMIHVVDHIHYYLASVAILQIYLIDSYKLIIIVLYKLIKPKFYFLSSVNCVVSLPFLGIPGLPKR